MSKQRQRLVIRISGKEFLLSHGELRWLVRIAAETYAGGKGGKQPYSYAYGQANRELRPHSRTAKAKLSHSKWTKLLAAGCALAPEEIAYIENALERVWLAGRSSKYKHQLVEDAVQYASAKLFKHSLNDGYEITPKGYSRLLRLGPQGKLKRLVGQYLIFRRHWSEPKVVVAHMTVGQDRLALYPAHFETQGKVADNSKGRPSKRSRRYDAIRGVMYRTNDNNHVVFAIGRYVGTKQVRLTILEHVSKSRDLAGVRLGLNDGRPAGYQVWCARLDNALANSDWLRLCGEYRLQETRVGPHPTTRLADNPSFAKTHGDQPHKFFQTHLSVLPEILRHLRGGFVTAKSPI